MPSLVCRTKTLPDDLLVAAAARAVAINPANRPNVAKLATLGFSPTPKHIAMVTRKYWGVKGVRLTVGFLDNPRPELRKKILRHMNAWGRHANVAFTASQTDPQVRISRVNHPPDDAGYWSYLGTEILSIDPGEATMNLEGFTMSTPDAEFFRVVRHETGHTLGFEHEHLRKELVQKIDVQKAIAFFEESDGWDEAETRAQVLTPLRDSTLATSGSADPHSIMCYEIPGEITIDGKPIVGGVNIDATDHAFAAKVYPKRKAAAKKKKKKAKRPRSR
jgi:hypothetical protein